MAEPVQEKDEVKQRAIRRLLVAVVLVVVAVGILTYLSYYKPTKVVTKPTPETLPPPPPPIVVAGPEPQIVQPAPAAPAAPVPPQLPELPTPPAPTPAPQAAPTPLPPPPPPSVANKPLPQPGPGPKKAAPAPQKITEQKPAEQKPLVSAQDAQQATKPTPPSTTKPAAATPQNYFVQFGVFTDYKNAQQLVEKLKQAGIEAQAETHVQLPAFKSKAEADAMLAKMREKGLTATVVAR